MSESFFWVVKKEWHVSKEGGGLDLMSYFQMFIESYFSWFPSGKDEMFEPFVSFKSLSVALKLQFI